MADSSSPRRPVPARGPGVGRVFGGGGARKQVPDPHRSRSPQPDFDNESPSPSPQRQQHHHRDEQYGEFHQQQQHTGSSERFPSSSPVASQQQQQHYNTDHLVDVEQFRAGSTSISQQQQQGVYQEEQYDGHHQQHDTFLNHQPAGYPAANADESYNKVLENARKRSEEISKVSQMAAKFTQPTVAGEARLHHQHYDPHKSSSSKSSFLQKHGSAPDLSSILGTTTASSAQQAPLVDPPIVSQATSSKLQRHAAPTVKSVLHLKPGSHGGSGGNKSPLRQPAAQPVSSPRSPPTTNPQIEADGHRLASSRGVFRKEYSDYALPGKHEVSHNPGGGNATAQRAMIRSNPQGYTVADIERLHEELKRVTKHNEEIEKEREQNQADLRELRIDNAELLKRFEHSQKSLGVALQTLKQQEGEIARLRQNLSGEVYDNASLKNQFKGLIDVAKSELGSLRNQVQAQERSTHYVGPTQGNRDVAGSSGLVHPFDRQKQSILEPTSPTMNGLSGYSVGGSGGAVGATPSRSQYQVGRY